MTTIKQQLMPQNYFYRNVSACDHYRSVVFFWGPSPHLPSTPQPSFLSISQLSTQTRATMGEFYTSCNIFWVASNVTARATPTSDTSHNNICLSGFAEYLWWTWVFRLSSTILSGFQNWYSVGPRSFMICPALQLTMSRVFINGQN